MAISFWLDSIRQKLATAKTRRARRNLIERSTPRHVERFEERSLLTVSVLYLAGDLQVITDADENIVVRTDPANTSNVQILVDGAAFQGIPQLPASAVTSLSVVTGDAENTVDLSNVLASAFTGLTAISVETGNGNDLITGSSDFGEIINSGDGTDTVFGNGGFDTIVGGNGNDSLTGGDGNDIILSGDGNDTVSGDAGDDTLDGGDNSDNLSGGIGNDSISGGDGTDSIAGGLGNDSITGDLGNDSILGDDGDDQIYGGGGDDTVDGNGGNDVVIGNGGQDSILGGDGVDTLFGKQGADSVFGGAGNDRVFGDEGDDIAEGGADDDYISGGGGNDLLRDDGIASSGGLTSADTMFGNSGNDTLIGIDGTDSVLGGAGNDLVDLRRITVSIDDVQVTEGNPPATNVAVFTVTLSSPSTTAVTVNFTTSSDGTNTGGTAIAGTDYTAASGQVIFAPGQTTQTITVDIIADTTDESDEETFFVNLTGANGAGIFDGLGEGRILDEDSTVSSTVADVILLFDDTSSFSATGPVVTSVFQNVVTDLINNFPGSDFAFGVARFESYFGGGDKAFVLNQPLISSTTANFNQAISAALIRNSPGSGAGAETMFEALHQIATGAGFDGNGDGDTTGDGPAGLVSTQTGNGVEDDVPAYSTFQPDPTGPVLSPTAPVASATDGIGLRPGARHIVLVATDSGNLVFQADNATTYTGVNNTSVPATTFQGTQSPANGNQATIQATLNELIADNVEVIGLYDPGFFGTNTQAELVAMATLTGAINRGNTTIESGITPGASADDIAPNQPLYFQIDATNPNQLRTAIVQAVTGAIGNVTPPPPPPPAPPTVVPGPQQDTVDGGDGNDTVFAGDTDDLIIGSVGDDFIEAGDGNDSVYGGSGNDTINGQGGDDFLQGQGGDDSVLGGAGDDTLVWKGFGQGTDTLNGGDGQDGTLVQASSAGNTLVVGSNSSGYITVAEGNQSLTVEEITASVTVSGGGGDDTITVGPLSTIGLGQLVINGDAGDDVIDATNAVHSALLVTLSGGLGFDTITGSDSGETINGDEDNDELNGRGGSDTINGGASEDLISGGSGDDSLSGGAGLDTINGDDGNDVLAGDEGNDLLDGLLGNDTLNGGFGNDTAIGGLGNDSVLGGLGSDILIGGSGNDTLDGGRNDDTLLGNSGNDRLVGDHGNDSIVGGDGNDTVVAGDGDDSVIGGLGNDLISAGDGNDFVRGDEGNDTIIGGDGNDTLNGGGGRDTLTGDQGDDLLNGNGLEDLASTGGGADTTVNIEVIDETFRISAAITAQL